MLATKNQIIRSNLRLVVSIAKRHAGPSNLFELVSDGNMSLIRAVDKFDFSRGNKFSTYASWAIIKNFARSIPEEHRLRDRFRTGHAELFAAAKDDRSDQLEEESLQRRRAADVKKILQRLDDRERAIIIHRFGLRETEQPLTLKQVGARLGVTKERVRQLETRALGKLRQAVQEEKIDVPGWP
jgi:RNA polymerase sigma factor (sigma-70 family)